MHGMGVSADGSVVVGYTRNTTTYVDHAFRWTVATGMVDLGFAPGWFCGDALGVCADGTQVIGQSCGAGSVATRWTASNGTITLPLASGATASTVFAVSADGSVILGWCGNPGPGMSDLCRWAAASAWAVEDLGPMVLPNNVRGASVQTLTVVGTAGLGGSSSHAFLWTPALGMVDLNAYLPTRGISLAGWELTWANAVSADGLTIVGHGLHGGGNAEAWVADLHQPPTRCGSADFNHDGDTATDQDIEAFFACIAGNCCPQCDSADFNGDGDVATDADIESFFRVLAGGPC
jgi:probable HAF family extracellular repeat protein